MGLVYITTYSSPPTAMNGDKHRLPCETASSATITQPWLVIDERLVWAREKTNFEFKHLLVVCRPCLGLILYQDSTKLIRAEDYQFTLLPGMQHICIKPHIGLYSWSYTFPNRKRIVEGILGFEGLDCQRNTSFTKILYLKNYRLNCHEMWVGYL